MTTDQATATEGGTDSGIFEDIEPGTVATPAVDLSTLSLPDLHARVAAEHQVGADVADKLDVAECIEVLTNPGAAEALLKTARRRLAGSKGGAAKAAAKGKAGGKAKPKAKAKAKGKGKAVAVAASVPVTNGCVTLDDAVLDAVLKFSPTAEGIDHTIKVLVACRTMIAKARPANTAGSATA
jgi:hypothetical protein